MNTNQRNLIAALSLCAVVIPNLATAAAISGQGTWERALQGRDLDGNLATAEAYYDTALNITWLADANYAGTAMTWESAFFDTSMSWAAANNWAAALNPYNSGITGWRLPKVSPVDGTTADDAIFSPIGTEDLGYNIGVPGTIYAGSTASEMAHMYYITLGDKGNCNPTTSTVSSCVVQAGYGLNNTGPFSNLQSYYYWSATKFAPINSYSYAWGFDFSRGFQYRSEDVGHVYAWAVHDGDVGTSVVPVPAAAWLFGSGLLGLVGIVKRKRVS